MRDPILKRFTVAGRAGFPLVLLRVDQCWPATLRDAAAIAPSDTGDAPRRVTLETAAKYAPNRRSWSMAGWPVAD